MVVSTYTTGFISGCYRAARPLTSKPKRGGYPNEPKMGRSPLASFPEDMAILAAIGRGEEDIAAGRTMTHEEVVNRTRGYKRAESHGDVCEPCVAPLGLGREVIAGDPGLAPWAKLCRPLGAEKMA